MTNFEHRSFAYGIRSNWMGRVESPASIGEKFINTLDALCELDPIFANWQVMDFRKKFFMPCVEARPRIAGIIEANVARDDLDQPAPVYGYHAAARTDGFEDSRSTTFRVEAGGQHDGSTWLQFGEWNVAADPAILTHSLFKAALLAVNTIWLGPWACAYAFRRDYSEVPLVPGAPLFPYSRFHIPWIAYLSAPYIVRLSLPLEILTERVSDGGLLMTATEEPFDPTNIEHLRRARILADFLFKHAGREPPR